LCLLLLPDLRADPLFEFVYDDAPFPQCHASTIVETRDGGLLAAWFGGTREGDNDVAVWISRRGADGWSPPEEFVREKDTPCWNPVLFRGGDGALWLFYKFGTSPREWTGAYRRSDDDGRTWGVAVHLPAGLLGPIKNKPLLLGDGVIVAGTSVESHQSWACWVERSRDHGRTWTRHGPIVHPRQPFGIIQPAIVPISGGRLRMFVRARGVGRICYADSFDGGVSWTDAKETSLPNPNSGIDAVALRDGRIVLVYNPTNEGRSPLSVAVSNDDGQSWERFLDLETDPGEYSYPAVIQSADDDLHITYTWNRERIRYVRVPLEELP
jgi:predicted neuraminidase